MPPKKLKGMDAIQELLTARKIKGGGLVQIEELIGEILTGQNELSSWPQEWLERVILDIKYSGYIEKEKRIIARNTKMEQVKLNPDMDYHAIKSLSMEAKEKFSAIRPLTIGQAVRVPGIRQGDIALLMVLARR